MKMLTEESAAPPIDHETSSRALRLGIRPLNAPLRTPMKEKRVLSSLSAAAWTVEEEPLARALPEEAGPGTLLDLARSDATDYAALADSADELFEQGHATRAWLDDHRRMVEGQQRETLKLNFRNESNE